MPSREYTGSVSRSVHHGNMMNKRGGAEQYQKRALSTKVPMKFKKVTKVAPVTKKPPTLDDLIVRAGPPKTVVKECRYTLPDVTQNNNINTQMYCRSHAKMAVIMNELKTFSKVKAFNEDVEHDIEVV
jgi:hypothetical protein